MSERLPSVSVVVPAYRQAAFVGRCLDAIRAQTYSGPVEVLVVDDGCPEQSGDVAEAHPSAPRVLRQQNGGVAAARNRGIAASTGEIVAFVDADDLWHPRKLERQIARMVAAGPSLSFTRYRRVDEGGTPLAADPEHPGERLVATVSNLVRQNFIGCSTVAVHRACLEAVGGFPEGEPLRRGGQDYALWLRIASRYPLAYLPEVLVDYTVHRGNRVGVDLLKNYRGAFEALHDAWRWDEAAFRRMAGGSYRRQIARCGADLGRALAARRTLEPTIWRDALAAVLSAVRR